MVNGGENIKNSDENYRMKYPLDVLNKRQFGYLGDIAHKYYNFPGKYDSPCFNEYPSVNGSALRTDTSYFIVMEDGQKRIMNVEDESGNVNKKVLRKIAKYRDNMRYTFKCPVNSAIKTSKSLENCLTCLKLSETDIITPIFRPIVLVDSREILNNILDRIENNYTFTEIEAFEILDVVRMFENNNHEMLEKICYALPKINIDSTEFFKLELIFGMRCVIHKYAKTVEDIKRLEEVIGLPNAKTARQFFEDKLFNEGKAEGFSEGRTGGHLEMAVKFVEKFGVDAVADASGFSRDEILKHSKK